MKCFSRNVYFLRAFYFSGIGLSAGDLDVSKTDKNLSLYSSEGIQKKGKNVLVNTLERNSVAEVEGSAK